MATPEVPKIEGLGGTKKMTLSSDKRASSAPKERPPPPLTPRARKASRSLFRELEGTVRTMHHCYKRTEAAYNITSGVMKELEASVQSSQKTLSQNSRMVAGTKETQPGAAGGKPAPPSPAGGSSIQIRPYTEDELEILKQELRNDIEANGEERDPTEEEVEAEMVKRMDAVKMGKEKLQRVVSKSNKPIVDALQKLSETSAASVLQLQTHQRALAMMLDSLHEIEVDLTTHKDMRDSLFDPLLSTDLPFAKKMGTKPIERSVLYQKMNFVPKNKDGTDMKVEWNDKDPEASEGKLGAILDSKGRKGLTAHEATFCAAEREDTARALCNAALKAVRSAQSQLASRKSALQVAVLNARQEVLKGKRAAKTGKFGSSEERSTDPSTRKMAATPEDQ